MPKPVIKDDDAEDDEFGPVEMADASSTSVNMSEDSEADEDDDAYSELDGVELYKEASSAATDDDQEEMEAATAPKLSSSSVACPLKEVCQRMSNDKFIGDRLLHVHLVHFNQLIHNFCRNQ